MAKSVAWGYVSRDLGGGRQLLVATRYKEDDPERRGQLVIPGGGRLRRETYAEAAMHEVREETGIITYRPPLHILRPDRHIWDRPEIIVQSFDDGSFLMIYKDSEKEYRGRLVGLVPKDDSQEPEENPESDARKPQYMLEDEAFARKKEFTPACSVLLDVIEWNGRHA